ncbi:MAG: FMN-dependent NADH-azoreductase [Puniceicoccales bacterium]
METLLVINSSGRRTRSITRRLTDSFTEQWTAQRPGSVVIQRDIGVAPPPPVNEMWISAAFSQPEQHTPEMRNSLAISDELIDEVQRADAIVIGTPIYNFGPPAQLKAWVDQVVRAGVTFGFDPTNKTNPYSPLLQPKPVTVIVSAGDGAMHPGGAFWPMNHLEPHLQTVFNFIGLGQAEFVRIGYDEFQDERLQHSLAQAEKQIAALTRAPACCR